MENIEFLVQDPLFNALLVRSNESLIRLGTIIGAPDADLDQLRSWNDRTKAAMQEKLFDPEKGAYLYYDLRNERLIDAITSSSLSPLFAGIPTEEEAKTVIDLLEGAIFSGDQNQYAWCASFNTQDDRFNPVKYWRGPIWVNLNWIIYHGLLRYGFESQAENVKADTLKLVESYGLFEYFHPAALQELEEPMGYGSDNFSWTAALILDLLME